MDNSIPKNKYQTGLKTYRFTKLNFKWVEAVGIKASYSVDANLNITHTANAYQLNLGIVSSILGLPNGEVSVGGSAILYVDGRRQDEKELEKPFGGTIGIPGTFNAGTASFALPAYGKIELSIHISYIVKTESGTTAISNMKDDLKYVISKITGHLIGDADILIYQP